MPLETVTTQMAGCWSFSSNKQNSFAAIQPECLFRLRNCCSFLLTKVQLLRLIQQEWATSDEHLK
jgi:hypothetical protein